MISLTRIAASVMAVGSIGAGAVTLDHLHVASEDFKQYIEQQQLSDERDYVLNLKEHIREIRYALVQDPDNDYLINEVASLMEELCEIRPNDKLCKE